MTVRVREVLCTPRAHSPAVEVKNPQSQGEVGLHGRGAPGTGLLFRPSDLRRPGRSRAGVGSSPGGAHRWSAPPPRSPEGRGPKPAQLRPRAEARRPGPTLALPGQPVRWSQLAARQAGKDVCGEIWELTGGEGRPQRARTGGEQG